MTLDELRRRAGMSQADLAKRLGVTAGAVGNWERGSRIPRLPMLRRLAAVFGVAVGDIEFPDEHTTTSELSA